MNVEKLSLKIVAWIIVIICVLGAIGFLIATPIGWLIIIIAIAGFLIHLRNKKARVKSNKENSIRKHRQLIKYQKSLAPANWTHRVYIHINSYDSQALGQMNRPINYMFTCNNNITTFPESRYGNNKGYYVIDVQFRPRWISINNGNGSGNSSNQTSYNLNGSQNTIGGGVAGGPFNNLHNSSVSPLFKDVEFGYGSHSNTNINGNSNSNGKFRFKTNSLTHRQEIPTNAIITLVTANLNNSFKIKLIGVNSNLIDYIRQYYLLDSIKKHKLGIW